MYFLLLYLDKLTNNMNVLYTSSSIRNNKQGKWTTIKMEEKVTCKNGVVTTLYDSFYFQRCFQ